VVVAASDVGPVGVDVELDSCAEFAGFDAVSLAESEQQQLAALSAEHRTTGRTQMWVRKEAVLKATGDGLTVDPRRVIVSPPSEPPRLLAWADGTVAPSDIQLIELHLGSGYVSCLAMVGPRSAPIRLRNGDELLLTS
jgi:4'-phosphopantetheinyl transferase